MQRLVSRIKTGLGFKTANPTSEDEASLLGDGKHVPSAPATPSSSAAAAAAAAAAAPYRGMTATTTPRPKSKLVNASGFFDPPPQAAVEAAAAAAAEPPPQTAHHAATAHSLADAFWDSGLLCAALACIIFALSGFCVKLTHGRVPVLELCLVRSSASFTMSIILMKGMRMSPMFGHRRNAPLLIARGCCGALSMAMYYSSLQLLPLGDAVTIGLVQPPLTAVAARLVLKEPLGARGALGCLISLCGVAFITQPPFLFHSAAKAAAESSAAISTRMLGAGFGLLSAAMGTGSALSIRKLGAAEKAPVIAMAFHTATMVLSITPLAVGWPQRAVLPRGHDIALLGAVAVTSFFAQLLMTRALQRAPAARVSAMSFTQVLYLYALSALCFQQGVSLTSAVGVLCTLCGVAFVVLRHNPRPQPPATATATAAASSSADENASLAERILLKQLSAHDSNSTPAPSDGEATTITTTNSSSEEQAQGRPNELAGARSLRALRSIRRVTSSFHAAASAQMSTAPSLGAAELAVAAEGACGASIVALVAATAAYEATLTAAAAAAAQEADAEQGGTAGAGDDDGVAAACGDGADDDADGACGDELIGTTPLLQLAPTTTSDSTTECNV